MAFLCYGKGKSLLCCIFASIESKTDTNLTQANTETSGRNLAIMQPYFFPYIGYFQLINAVDKFVIYDDVNFIKRGWIHRNNILVNGQANMFSVPLSKPSQHSRINEVALGDWQPWAAKFQKTLEQNYKKAPYFTEVYALIGHVLAADHAIISDLAVTSLLEVCRYLGIKTEFVGSSTRYGNDGLKAQHRILDICLQEKVTHYINPTGGKELYDKQLFAQSGIRLDFIESGKVTYPQYKNEFVPWLSIIDVLMFNSVEATNKLLANFTLS